MKKILFLLAMLPMMFACSSSDDEPEIQIILSKTEISLDATETEDVLVDGVDLSLCSIKSEDEFIADAKVNGRTIEINGNHVGLTKIIVKCDNKESEISVEVKPEIDYIGDIVSEWGISYNEFKDKVEKPYESFMDNPQRGSKDYTYSKNGYKIVNRYFFENDALVGVKKEIKTSDMDIVSFDNVTTSMFQYVDYVESSVEDIQSYPKSHKTTVVCLYPSKYYSVYEQTRYDILYETGKAPSTKNYIFYAKDLDTAKKHSFDK